MVKKTNNGKKGGLLDGKPHNDSSGKPVGGIKAIVTDTNQIVELEGGEVIINKEASKLHWKQLSKINQSAGNGVPILPPDEVLADVYEYRKGGNLIQFNPNNLPSKWLLKYAKELKKEYPEIWDLGGNVYGNEAFENLERVEKRGHWLDSEEWFYVKWQSFNARHKGDFLIEGVIANLKWANKVQKGWKYMKDLIEAEIEKRGLKKMSLGGEIEENKEEELEEIIEDEKSKLDPKLLDSEPIPDVFDYAEPKEEPILKKDRTFFIDEHAKVIDNTNTVKIGKVEKTETSDIFYNPDIFVEEGDYILGGFNAQDLNGIDVVGDSSALNYPKLEYIFEKRLTNAVEAFKKEVRESILSSTDNTDDIDFDKEIFDELSNLMETYLGVKLISSETEDVVSQIMRDSSYICWSERIKERVSAYKSRITGSASDVNEVKPSAVTVKEAEYETQTAKLEQMLEKLFNINEENTY